MARYTITIRIPDAVERVIASPLLFYRWLRYGYSYRCIPLTQGKFTIVDQRDFEKLRGFKWCVRIENLTCYAVRNERTKSGTRCLIMHRVIMNPPKGYVVDHINCDGLDNRRANLRVCTCGENSFNRRILKKGTSRYKGVSWTGGRRPWRALIYSKRRQFHLGQFETEVEAAKAYDAAAKKYHKEFARLNFSEGEGKKS